MATAVELLSKTIEEVLVIDSSLRTINIPASVTNIGVESDDETTKLNFQMPRFNDGIDLSGFVVRINYENAGGEGDVYEATDVEVNDDTITFSWLVGRFAVMYKGTVKFIVCLKKLGNDGTVDKEFNTTVATLPVLVGLETEEAAVEANMDVIAAAAYEAILLGLDNGLKGDPGYTPVKGTDYYTTAERDEFAEEVVNAAKGVYANAYKQTVKGDVVRVDDVSPLEHTVGVKVHGKNLLPVGTIEVTKNQNVRLDNPIPPGTYTLSAYITSSDTDGELSSVSINSASNVLKYVPFNRNKRVHTTFTVTEPITAFDFCAAYNYSQGVDDTATWSDIQLEIGDTATEYSEYVDPSTVTLTRCGKNLLPLDNFTYTPSTSKATFTNGVLTVNGYIAARRISVSGLIGKRLTISCNSTRTGEKGGGLAVEFRDPSNTRISGVYHQNELSPKFSFTIPEGTAMIVVFFYASGSAESTGTATYKNVQLEFGEEITEHQSYVGETYTPSTNGVVENVYSVSPSMTLYTDTPGVTIEAEYSRDMNLVLEEVLEKIKVGSGGSGGSGESGDLTNYYTKEEIDKMAEGLSSEVNIILGNVETFIRTNCVFKETGKGLSTNDFTNEYKTKVDASVSQEYVDEQIGDIETALDSILALQSSYIGGSE